MEIVPTPQTPFEWAFAWLVRSGEPLATAGIIWIFAFLALLDIADLRNRFLRLLGGNFHRSTDAIQKADARISRYLLIQLLVNVSYGVSLATGLWIIGVPGAPSVGRRGRGYALRPEQQYPKPSIYGVPSGRETHAGATSPDRVEFLVPFPTLTSSSLKSNRRLASALSLSLGAKLVRLVLNSCRGRRT